MNTIFKYYQDFIDFKAAFISPSSLKKYYTVAKNLRIFLLKNREYKTINCINSIKFMRSFNAYLNKQYGRMHVKRHLDYIKSFIIFLVNDEIVKYSKIRDYKILLKKEAKKIIILSEKELMQVEELQHIKERLLKTRDLFLFQCYTGISYGDTQECYRLKKVVYDGCAYIIGNRSKNEQEYIVPLSTRAADILNKYDWDLPKISNQKYNQYLKELAILSGIEKKLTTHVGRKTYGQLKLNMGYSIEAVSKMLGHSNTRVTQQYYARPSLERVHEEFKKLVA